MDELFSCRNCVHNSGQSLNIGRGSGFCLKHDSVIVGPARTTCKYLHRKDLPQFVIDEGIREHAAEFAGFPALVGLRDKQPIVRVPYSEHFVWRQRSFDPVLQSLAQYYKSGRSWVFVQTFSGGLDGRRSLAHAALIRRYMDRCGTWASSYRLILAMIQEIATTPMFDDESIEIGPGEDIATARTDALWDVVFTKLAGLQEYGFHAGLENLMWVTDELNGSLSAFDWERLRIELSQQRKTWTDLMIAHAVQQGVFFPEPAEGPPNEEP